MKGIELGTGERMSQVIAEITGAGPGPDRGRLRAEPGAARSPPGSTAPPWWPAPTRHVAEQLQKACHTGLLPALHQPGRGRLRARRRGKECDRAGGRHRGRHGAGRQHQGHAHHQGAGRDRPARRGARRRPAHLRRAGRHGRPGGDVQLAAVPEPHLRREAGPRHAARRGAGQHHPGGRRRQVGRVGASAGPQARRGDADHRGDRGVSARGAGHRPGGAAAGQQDRPSRSVTASEQSRLCLRGTTRGLEDL